MEHWHYSKSLPTPPLAKIGVWEDGEFIGAVLFSRGASDGIGKPYGLDQTECVELTRVALSTHKTPVSRIVAIAIKFIRKEYKKLRLLISFADPAHGHIGGIYQAGGWVFCGKMSDTKEYIDPNGKRTHGRMISSSGKKKCYGAYRAVFKPDQCKEIVCPGKYKYLMPLDLEMRAKILPLAKPYPKRVRSDTVDTSGVQPEKGRSTRTRTLHKKI